MATLNGFALKASHTITTQEKATIKISSLYLGPTKVATIVDERNVPDCEDSIQTLVRHPFREEKLRATLALLHPEQPDFGPEDLVRQLEWLSSLEQEYIKHSSKPNGGMLALNLEGGQVTLGIPLKFASADEDTILASCQGMFSRYEALYGAMQGYLIFHSLQDFDQGQVPDAQALK